MSFHNTFDLERKGEQWEARSHNFPEVSALGDSEFKAIDNMDRNIRYMRDNERQIYDRFVQQRVSNKVTCLCGFVSPEGFNGPILN